MPIDSAAVAFSSGPKAHVASVDEPFDVSGANRDGVVISFDENDLQASGG